MGNLQKEGANLVDTQCSFNKELERTLGTTPSSTNTIIGSHDNNSSMLSMMNMNMTHNDIIDTNLSRNDVYSMAETIDQNLTSLNERLQIKINELNQTNQSFKNNKHPLTPVV